MNRITAAIAKMAAQLESRIASGLTTKAKIEATRKSLDMEFGEYCRFQELKSLAVMSGKLTPEEGTTLYSLLGNLPSTFNARNAATKVVLTQIFADLLK